MSTNKQTGRTEISGQTKTDQDLIDINNLFSQITLRHNKMAPHVARKHATRWTKSSQSNGGRGQKLPPSRKEDWHAPHHNDILRKNKMSKKQGKQNWKKSVLTDAPASRVDPGEEKPVDPSHSSSDKVVTWSKLPPDTFPAGPISQSSKIVRKKGKKYSFFPQSGMDIFPDFMGVSTCLLFSKRFDVCLPQIDPQSGLAAMATHSFPPIISKFLNKLDVIVAQLFVMSRLGDDTSARIVAAHTLVRALFPEETDLSHIYNLFSSIVCPTVPQSSGPSWADSLRDVLTNWKLMKTHPLSSSLSTLLSACVLLGVIGPGKFKFSIGDLELFSKSVKAKQVSAVDVFDAMMETVIYFFEVGYAILETRSLSPLLFMTDKSSELAIEISFLKANAASATNGSIESLTDGVTVDQYRERLVTCLDTLKGAIRTLEKGSFERVLYQRHHESLENIYNKFLATQAASCQRIRPYAGMVHASSGVGKTTFTRDSVVYILSANGFEASDNVIITQSDTDQYDSNMRSDVQAIIDDDVANQKPKFAPFSAAARIINVVNSKPYSANMAAVEDKGKIACNAKVYFLSTNHPSLDAYETSNCPSSVLCRFQICVKLEVKPEFRTDGSDEVNGIQLDSAKVFAKFGKNGESDIDPHELDVWNITVTVPFVKPGFRGNTEQVGYKFAEFEGKKMENVNYETYLRFLCYDSKRYFANQRALLSRSLNVVDRIAKCKHGLPLITECDQCKACADVVNDAEEDSVEQQSGALVGSTLGWFLRSWFNGYFKSVKNFVLGEISYFEHASTQALFCFFKDWRQSVFNTWTDYIPDTLIDTRVGKYAIRRAVALQNAKVVLFSRMCFIGAFSHSIYLGFMKKMPWIVVGMSTVALAISYKAFVVTVDAGLERRLLSRRDALCEVSKNVREQYVIRAIKFVGAIGAIYTGVRVLQEFVRAGREVTNGVVFAPFGISTNPSVDFTVRTVNANGAPIDQRILKFPNPLLSFEEKIGARGSNIAPHGNLSPTSYQDVCARDSEVNPYRTPVTEKISVGPRAETMTHDNVSSRLEKHLIHFSVEHEGCWRVCNGLIVTTNVLMIPRHILMDNENLLTGKQKTEFNYRIIRRGPQELGAAFVNRAYSRDCYALPNCDFCFVHMPSIGDARDIRYMMVENGFYSGPASLHYRNNKGVLEEFPAHVQNVGKVKHNGSNYFSGGYSTVPSGTFSGLCIGTYVSKGKRTAIVGFHLGGCTGADRGIYGNLTRSDVDNAVACLEKQVGMSVKVQSGSLPLTIMGEAVLKSETVHPKCPTNFIDEVHTNIAVLGSCVGKSTFRPTIVTSMISSSVEAHCGVPQKWGNPSQHPWKFERNFITNVATGATKMDTDALCWAMDDWVNPLISWAKDCGLTYNKLTEMQSVCGIDGCRWIDALNKSTAIGFPLTGKKKDFLTPLNSCDWPEWNEPYGLGPELIEEKARILECYAKSERAYPVFKSSPKNEAIALAKDKKRLFQVAPAAFQVIVREYFLDLAAKMSQCPLLSECSVGINCASDEWEQMISHLEQFPSTNCIAGDYKNYDQIMGPEMTRGAWTCLIRFARALGATEREIHIMECIASDIVNPIVAMEGTLLHLKAGNPSGQNLTAHINCIVNSLLLRCAWYISRKDKGVVADSFRDHVALQVYGDDNLATTDSDDYSMVTISEVLGRFGYIYTDASKSLDIVPFIPLAEAEYLKRHSVYHEALGCRVGALGKDSIFKSLHCYDTKSKVSREEHALAVVTGALQEMFLHGPAEFENFRLAMTKVLGEHGLVLPVLNNDYTTRSMLWHECNSLSTKVTTSEDLEASSLEDIPYFLKTAGPTRIGLSCGDTIRPGNCFKNKGQEETDSSISGLVHFLNEQELDSSDIDPQSGTASTNISTENPNTWHQTLQFADGSPGDMAAVDNTMSTDTISGDFDQLTLKDFFRRPVNIHTAEWTQGVDSSFRINPWGLFILNPRVANRIANFARMRFSLKVKVTITGNGFYYGRMMVSYLPLEATDQLTQTRAGDPYDFIEASQRPHILLDPTLSEGGTMELPFFFPDEAFDVVNGNAIGAGVLDFIDLTELNHANGFGGPIKISVFAWTDNMELSCPTKSTPAGLAPQSGYEKMMGDDGPTRQLVSNAQILEPSTMGDLASGEASLNAVKLTFSRNQQTSTDTRMMGLDGIDEMNIKSWVTRQSYLTKTLYTSTLGEGDVLFSTKVHTGMFDSRGEPTEYHFTPVGWIQQLFSQWRGTMKFRFLVVGSAHHRGRLRINWDPVETSADTDTNVGYNYIVDIAEERDFTIEVGWGAKTGMLSCPPISQRNPPFSVTEHETTDSFESNGVLTLSVFDPLTLPSDLTSAVSILVWVSAGDDMEFAAPRTTEIGVFQVFPQSGVEQMSEDMKHRSSDDDPDSNNVVASFSSAPGHTQKALDIYCGEKIESVRALANRVNFHSYFPVLEGNEGMLASYITLPTYPFFRGRDPLGFDTLLGNQYSYCNTIPLQWIMMAFTGYRGGINVHALTYASGLQNIYTTIARSTFGNVFFQQGQVFGASSQTIETATYSMRQMANGFAGNHNSVNPSVSVEIPYHTTKKFLPCKRNDQLRVDVNRNFLYAEVWRLGYGLGIDVGTMLGFSAAPDFQVGFFTGSPVMYLIEETFP